MPSVKVVRPAPAKNSRSQNAVKLPGSLSLVLPAHNEEENIRVVVEQALEVLPKFTSEFEIIVVNDGSRDHTAEIIDDLAATDSRVYAIHHKRNKGYGGALTTGFKATTSDYVMFMDSDRQFDISDIALLAPFVGKYDIVAGVRLERNDPFHRRLFAEVFNLTVRVLFGVHLHDIDCAFKIFRGDLLRSMELTAPGALINTEIQAKARRQGATVEQVGVHHYPRVAGEASGGSPKVIFRAMRETILLWWRMHSYVPPTTSKKPKGPYLFGDFLLGAATFLGIPAIISFGRRLFRRN
jgi:glycosyltransferase involved in cell wall biosynthesis